MLLWCPEGACATPSATAKNATAGVRTWRSRGRGRGEDAQGVVICGMRVAVVVAVVIVVTAVAVVCDGEREQQFK